MCDNNQNPAMSCGVGGAGGRNGVGRLGIHGCIPGQSGLQQLHIPGSYPQSVSISAQVMASTVNVNDNLPFCFPAGTGSHAVALSNLELSRNLELHT